MNPELNFLCLSILLGIAQLLIAATGGTIKRGLAWNAGPRDQPTAPLPGKAGRLDRAFQNFKETFPFFLGAVFLVQATQHSNPMTVLGCQLYFWSRLIYVPIYFLGIPFIRTLTWGVSMVGICLLLCSIF